MVAKNFVHDSGEGIKYKVFNYGKGTVSLPYKNPVEKIQEFQLYLKKAISESNSDELKSRSIINLGHSEEISALEAEYINPEIEKLVFFFDTDPHEERRYGVAFSTLGIYCNYFGEKKLMPWQKLAEEYAIRVDLNVEIVEPDSVMDEDADPVMEINLSQILSCDTADEFLFDVICKGCDIFVEMEGTSQSAGSEGLKEQVAQKTGSILKRNPAGVIMSIIVSIIVYISAISVLGFILTPILAFVGYLIGNKLRLWLHPDFVMASGFMGLLKEKIFWRFIPQLIGTFIGAFIGAGIGVALF
jgi:hypothetical protein